MSTDEWLLDSWKKCFGMLQEENDFTRPAKAKAKGRVRGWVKKNQVLMFDVRGAFAFTPLQSLVVS